MSAFRRGLILGKFMPPHAGHLFLARFARSRCEALTVLVCSLAREPIEGALRHRWMQALLPDCDVVHVAEDVPQTPEESPDFWPIWHDLIRRHEPRGFDAFFSSELYGDKVAEVTGTVHVMVDRLRQTVPISATAIRADPGRHWAYIPEPVRPYFASRAP